MWAAGRSLFRKRNFYSSGQPANIIKNTLPCSITRNADFLQRFSSVNFSDDPTSSSTKLEDDVDRKLKYIKLEMTNLRDEGQRVPELSYVKPQHWDELLKFESKTARMRYYHYLFINEKRSERDKLKKQEWTRSYLAFKKQQGKEENSHITYSLFKTSMMIRIDHSTMNIWRNNRLRRAMQFGEKIVFDCSYDPFMTRREAQNAAKQLTICFAENRRHKDPFDLHFCNVNFNGNTFARLERDIPNVRDKAFPLNLYEGSYLDLFPREKLVYLTPHCRNDLTEYDPDSIYIIGAMVDKRNHEPLSLMKAKELNLKIARLPLDRYLEWNGFGKTLTLDQMMRIMLTLKTSRSWDCALKHVPRRKIVNEKSNQQKRVTKWTVTVNKSKENFRTDYDLNLRGGSERDTLPTAEKFKRKIGTDDKFARNAESSFNFKQTDSLVSTADKFKKPKNRNSYEDKDIKTRIIDVKTLLNE